MNPETAFTLAEDGWFHIATPGEWPHKPTGLTQILDDEAMSEIVKAFVEFKAAPNWPGVLIDFDHQSLDQDKPTTAAGWISDLESRDTGLWARVRWSDIGRKSIEGGRYRFISPVWKSTDCKMLGEDRIRPLKLMNCAVTNDPNIKGLFPLSNSATAPIEFTAPAMPIENRRPLTRDQEIAIIMKKRGGGGASAPAQPASTSQGPAASQPPTVIGDPTAAHMRGQPAPPAPPQPGTIASDPTAANWYGGQLRPEVETMRAKARREATEAQQQANQQAEIQWARAELLKRAWENAKPKPKENQESGSANDALALARSNMGSKRKATKKTKEPRAPNNPAAGTPAGTTTPTAQAATPPAAADPYAGFVDPPSRADVERYKSLGLDQDENGEWKTEWELKQSGYVEDENGNWTKKAVASHVPAPPPPTQYTSTHTWTPDTYGNRRAELDFIQNSIRLAKKMTDQQLKWWFATMGQRGGGGGSTATRDHDARISSYNQQIANLESSRRERPEMFAPEGIRNWRDTQKRLMRENADSGTILAAVAADKAHNKNVRDYLRAQKRSIKRRFKDKGAQERALERERKSEIAHHDKAVRDWQRDDDRITREIRRLEGRRDEEVAKASDSELKAQAKDATEGGKTQRALMAALSRAHVADQKTQREREKIQGRIDRDEAKAALAAGREAERAEARAIQAEIRRNDPDSIVAAQNRRSQLARTALTKNQNIAAVRLLYPEHASRIDAFEARLPPIMERARVDRDQAGKMLAYETDLLIADLNQG